MECEIKDGQGKVKTFHYKDVKILKFEGVYLDGKRTGNNRNGKRI